MSNVQAQDQLIGEFASFWDIQLGANALELNPELFGDYACGTNGGPPSIPINGWADYATCPAEPDTGLHEVQFRYDDEPEYWAKANGAGALILTYEGTKLFTIDVIISALFDDDGFLVGLRAVTDPRVSDEERLRAISFRNFVMARFDPESWACEDLPRDEGETPIGNDYIKERCTKSTDTADLMVESHYLRRPGQYGIDPRTNQPVAGLFESTVRFEMFLNHPIEDREERLAYIQTHPRPPSEAEVNRERALDCPGCDLTGLNLKRQDLTGANLAGADLSGANLHRAILVGADLTGANLTGANLNKANLRQAQMSGAILTGALLYGAVLDAADLTGADLSHSKMQESRMTRAILDDARVVAVDLRRATASQISAVNADFGGTWFHDAEIRRSDFTSANFQQAVLQSTILTDCDFTDAQFLGADLILADLRGSTLTRTDFAGARLTNAKLADTNREDALMDDVYAPP